MRMCKGNKKAEEKNEKKLEVRVRWGYDGNNIVNYITHKI